MGTPLVPTTIAGPLLALAGTHVQALDEPAWLDQLLARRPELVMQHEGTIRDPAWQALVIEPQYRNEILANPSATWESIVAREYTDTLRAADQVWVASLRSLEAGLAPTSPVHAGPQADTYAWFTIVAPGGPDASGLDYKVFLDFTDFSRSLMADRVAGFAGELNRRGFVGDFKIDLRPGVTRFDYNQVIFHATTTGMAFCAEAVGLSFFGPELAHVARGVDAPKEGKQYDWHHFLLTAGFDQLPAEVKDYVRYRAIVPQRVCPNA